jgi:peroxiredoxin
MTSRTAMRREHDRQESLDQIRKTPADRASHRRRLVLGAWAAGLVMIVALVVAGLLSARPTQSSDARLAPDFTLPTSDGRSVSLSSLRGSPVLLYFSEGAGCDACLLQMNLIEKDPAFAAAGIRVLPIVMNTAAQISAEMTRLEVKTPFLLDDGTVSQAYGTLGKGMHQGLPGHGFVLVDAKGIQKWAGEYPSMYLAPETLMNEITTHL